MAIAPLAAEQTEQTLLDGVRRAQAAARSAEVELLAGALEWAVSHPPLDRADRCAVRISRPGYPDAVEPLNAEGVPEVSAVAVAELAVALEMSTESGRRLVSDVLELAYRLPCVWERVLDGRVMVWQARRIAVLTHPLARLAARFVDRQLAAVIGRIGMGQVERLVAEAVARYDHALSVERIRHDGDDRGVEIELDRVGLDGIVPVSARLDLPDAIALDAAVGHAATELAALGCRDTLPARRARGLGDLAREHLSLWQQDAPSGRVVVDTAAGTITPVERLAGRNGNDAAPGGARRLGAGREGRHEGDEVRARSRASRRQLVLHVHLTDATIRGGRGAGPLGRVDDSNTPISAEAIRRWCGDPHTKLTVLPVLDLGERLHHAGYEVPDRMREQVIGRDVTCVYPGCHAPARRCDLDHIVPYDHEQPARGGPTETANLAALCRRHHNLKTSGRIGYVRTEVGEYVWHFPTGTRSRRDPFGTWDTEPAARAAPGRRRSGRDRPPDT